MKEPVKILVCPLNWGIGHASRMIPVIHQLLHARAEVILAACGKSAELLKTEFPDQTFIDLPSFPVRYSRKRSQIFILALQIPLILVSIIKEHMRLKKITAVYSPDVIISDNRYGLFHKKIISVFVTHQVSPALPAGLTWMEPFVFHFLGFFIKRFDRCWIPDVRDPSMNLTGRLSHRYTPFRNMAYMGILSR
ncbi:MAG TPA: glycosyltransferase, partial [Caldithrix sp.]|nr:glycosyltransferase [Caldithrix sp.]